MRGEVGLVLAYAAGAWLAAFSLLAWRRQDEFERAAQKFSWVFGGLFGLLGSLALLPVVTQPGVISPTARLGRRDPERAGWISARSCSACLHARRGLHRALPACRLPRVLGRLARGQAVRRP